MKKSLLTALLVVAAAAPLHATDRAGDQGVGVMIGNPSGLSYKMFLDNRIAIDGAFGVDQGRADAHVTLLYHDFDVWKRSPAFQNVDGDMPLYFGVGPRALFDHDTEFGLRFVVGTSFFPANTPWEIFGVLAPVLRFTPDSGADFDFAVGVRYYIPAIRPRS